MSADKQVEKIAALAKLRFDPESLEAFVPTFEQILQYFEQLEQVETEETEPTYHALHGLQLETPLRADEPAGSLPVGEALGNAPETKDSHFRVPKVIE
jgi:aspartyl-tRNA(Asn)/glutamyl-tRNA(Gln) amidotransferase subunit C